MTAMRSCDQSMDEALPGRPPNGQERTAASICTDPLAAPPAGGEQVTLALPGIESKAGLTGSPAVYREPDRGMIQPGGTTAMPRAPPT